MNSATDQQLLRDYSGCRSEAAFAELVRRHVDLVYSAALRMVRDAHLAEDVTQGVFVALAHSARQLAEHPVLSGWLHRTAQNLAANAVRTDVRRRAREQEAAAMNELLSGETDATWEHIAPHLDAALGELTDSDRDALLLRYFERQSAQQMAQVLGVSDDAAQKRVSRAVDRLREFLAQRGVTVGTSGLVIVISTNAVLMAPAGLSAAITAAAAVAGTTIATTAIAATKTIAMTALQKTLLIAVLAAAVGTSLYEARRASALHAQLGVPRQQPASTEQLNYLMGEASNSASQVTALRVENQRLSSNTVKLMRLRNEVTRLRADAVPPGDNSTEASLQAWLNRVAVLKQRLEQQPDQKIPEMELLVEDDWLNVTRKVLTTEVDYRNAFSSLRSAAEYKFGNMLSSALRKYLAANDNQFPVEPSQLAPYFEKPFNEAVWQRYAILPADGVLGMTPTPGEKWLITQKAPVDFDFDSRTVVGDRSVGARQSGGVWRRFKEDTERAASNRILLPVLNAFMEANGGKQSNNPEELFPFTTTPEQKALLEKLVQQFKSAKAAGLFPR